MELYGLQHQYGVVKYRGNSRVNSEHELVFESDNALAVLRELEKVCPTADPDHDYMFIFKEEERHRRMEDRRCLQDRREEVRAGAERRRTLGERRTNDRFEHR